VDDLAPFINVKAIRKEWDAILSRQPKTGITGLWKVINLGAWLKVHGATV
jgi:hypothetical protein